MAGKMIQHFLLRGLAVIARQLVRPTNGLVVFDVARFTDEILPPLFGLVILVALAIHLNFRRPEDPSLANGNVIPVNQWGTYECTRLDYLGPVKPGFSIQTSIS